MDSGLETALVSASIAAVVSVTVAVISPLFTHHLWKRQKRKEQQLAVAERFAARTAEMVASTFLNAVDSVSAQREKDAARLEVMGILYLVPILFETSGSSMLAAELRNHPLSGQRALNKIRDLQVALFAEALDLPYQRSTESGE